MKKNKVVQLAFSIVQTLVLIVLVSVTLLSFSYKLPLLAKNGVTFYTVISQSMEPAIPVGSIIYSGKYKLEDLKKGDVITFVKGSKEGRTLIVTHRINSVDIKEVYVITPDKKQKKFVEYKYYTKGDANNVQDDGYITPKDILGKYQWHMAKIGYIASFAQTQNGFVLLVLCPAAILIVWEVISVIMYFKKKYESKSKMEIEALKAELSKKKSKSK